MPPYTPELLEQINELIFERRLLATDVAGDFITHPYRTKEGEDFGKYGFARRLTTLRKCSILIFDELPPEQEDIPEDDQREKAAIYLQSFVLNTFGCTDCLSWVWVYEKNVRDGKGNELKRLDVGLHPKQELRNYLPDALRQHMGSIDRWFADLKDVRDALMHRIPIYIPPYFVTPDRAQTFNALSVRMKEARARHDQVEFDRLEAEQNGLRHYLPLLSYTSKLEAPQRQAEIHRLLLNDLLTIADLGQRFMEELRRP